MASNSDEDSLAGEVCRAVAETREALGALAQRCCLTPTLMSISTLIDRITVSVTSDDGDSAFQLNEDDNHVTFRAHTLRKIISEADVLANEIGLSDSIRARQLAINLFIVHEVLHIRQNFPHFATVAKIKGGFSGIGLPMLDIAADTVSAWICAHVEAYRVQMTAENEILQQYVNMLIFSYTISAFVYDSRSKSAKRQRALGLVVSAILVQAKVEGNLLQDGVYHAWQPMSPIMLLDLDKAGTFNAIVIDTVPGLLLNDKFKASIDKTKSFWESVGRPPVYATLQLAAQLLGEMGALKT
jgi:hypothetical protein